MLREFPAPKALAHARALAFPRRTGGPGGQKSRDYLLTEFQKLGYAVAPEAFPIRADPSLFVKAILSLTLLILVVSYLLSRNWPLPASFLMLIPALAIIRAGSWWNAWIASDRLPFKPRANPGINLLASLPPAQEERNQVVLVSHYDSKSQSLSLVGRSVLLICLVILCLLLSFFYLSASQPGWSFFLMPSRKQVAFLSAVAALCALLVYKNKTFDTSPGALDDASGLGVLLALAETLKNRVPSQVRVSFLITDAEEEGLLGAWSYVKSHRAELSAGNPYILNLDGVGIKGRLRLTGESRSDLAARILTLAKRRGIALKRSLFLPGILMDHIPFCQSGLEAISLFCLFWKRRGCERWES
jgi:hypothetical protein